MADEPAADPRRIVVAGDLHGNTSWALHMARESARLLEDEENRIILQLGDFGIWPDDDDYLLKLSGQLKRSRAILWFLPGNHEDWSKLLHAQEGWDGTAPIEYQERIWYLPRNFRWQWHGRTWLALGGAVSPDKSGLVLARDENGNLVRRPNRTEGIDWWREEAITEEEFAAAEAAGHADIMATHACPAGVVHAFGERPSWWNPADLAESEAHDIRLQQAVEKIRPSHLMHGHLHMLYQRTCTFSYGECEVTGLHRDGTQGNFMPLDIGTMTWHPELVIG